MKFVDWIVKRGAALLMVMLFTTTAACATEFKGKAERIFSPSVIRTISETGNTGEIIFKVPERAPDYFDTGDKANKVFAIEAARVFRDVPSLERLKLSVPTNGAIQVMDISRAEMEQHYGVSFAVLNGNPDLWRNDFIQRYDNKKTRANFVERFTEQR